MDHAESTGGPSGSGRELAGAVPPSGHLFVIERSPSAVTSTSRPVPAGHRSEHDLGRGASKLLATESERSITEGTHRLLQWRSRCRHDRRRDRAAVKQAIEEGYWSCHVAGGRRLSCGRGVAPDAGARGGAQPFLIAPNPEPTREPRNLRLGCGVEAVEQDATRSRARSRRGTASLAALIEAHQVAASGSPLRSSAPVPARMSCRTAFIKSSPARPVRPDRASGVAPRDRHERSPKRRRGDGRRDALTLRLATPSTRPERHDHRSSQSPRARERATAWRRRRRPGERDREVVACLFAGLSERDAESMGCRSAT